MHLCLFSGMPGETGGRARLFIVLESGVEKEGDDEGGVLIVPVVGEFGGGEGGVAFEEALIHFGDIHRFRNYRLHIYNDGVCLLGVFKREIVDTSICTNFQ